MTSLAGTQVLVTGAGGFIGSHLTERLAAEGARVRALVRYGSRGDLGCLAHVPPETRARVEVIFADLRDAEAVLAAMRDVELVFHLGALIAIPYSYRNPREVVDTNVGGTLNVLMAARALRPARLVHVSTSEVYGTARAVPMTEDHPQTAQSPYAASKIAADQLVESFARAFELAAVTVRPFNTYGPRQSARAVIPAIVSQALALDVVRLGDLTPRRDLTYVADTVDGLVRAAVARGVTGETLHLGSGRGIAIGDLARLILRLVGRQVELVSDEARFRPPRSEVRELLADASKAGRLLGWAARTPLEAGLLETIDWVRRHPERFDPGRYAT